MNTLFYLFISCFIIFELFILSKIKSYANLNASLLSYLKDKKEAKKQGIVFQEEDKYKEELIKAGIILLIGILEWFFMFIGLISKNSWPIFLFLSILPLITGYIKIKPIIFRTIYLFIIKLLKIILMIFALLNSYHFHYDIISLVFR